MACLKGNVVANVVVPAPDYVRFATHHRFRPDFCHAADPESKGIVENLVGYAKDDLLTPLNLEEDPWAGGYAGLNERARTWGQEVNGVVTARSTRSRPSDWPRSKSCSAAAVATTRGRSGSDHQEGRQALLYPVPDLPATRCPMR